MGLPTDASELVDSEQIAAARESQQQGLRPELRSQVRAVGGGTTQGPTYLASLETDLALDGDYTAYYFTSPRGQTAITARAVSSETFRRAMKLLGLGLAAIGFVVVDRIGRRWFMRRAA